MTTEDTPFEVGKANTVWESKDPQVALIACGTALHSTLHAARELEEEGDLGYRDRERTRQLALRFNSSFEGVP